MRYKIATPVVKVETSPGHSLIRVSVNGQELCRLIVSTPLCKFRDATWECAASLEWRSPNVRADYMESTTKVGDARDYDEEVVLFRNQERCTNAYPHMHLKLEQGQKHPVGEVHNLVIDVED